MLDLEWTTKDVRSRMDGDNLICEPCAPDMFRTLSKIVYDLQWNGFMYLLCKQPKACTTTCSNYTTVGALSALIHLHYIYFSS